MIKFIVSALIILIFSLNTFSQVNEPVISDETQECIDCHESLTPGIYSDWLQSRHSKMTIAAVLLKLKSERRISIEKAGIGQNDSHVIGCYECHSLNPDKHTDNFEHFGYQINVVVSPNDCSTCHPVEVEQYLPSKKGYAYGNLKDNPVYSLMVETLVPFDSHSSTESIAQDESCYACHGTEVKVAGMKTIDSELGELEVPILTNWPNQGVGRINPDGSRGACTSCHPRHSFSIEVARKPHTCGQCHLEPDVPAYNVYLESKHGNIYKSNSDSFNWNDVPWQPGIDFTAPTCAVCHNSELADADGKVIVERTHDFGSRLWLRIFGLPYSHPQPKSGSTFTISNAAALPLPVTFDNIPASDYLISEETQAERKDLFSSVCISCHSTSWIDGQFEKLEKISSAADNSILEATNIMTDIWNKKIEDNKNPFDEEAELLWVKHWLFYANSIRYATAMMGPDYAAFKNGWWNAKNNIVKMRSILEYNSK